MARTSTCQRSIVRRCRMKSPGTPLQCHQITRLPHNTQRIPRATAPVRDMPPETMPPHHGLTPTNNNQRLHTRMMRTPRTPPSAMRTPAHATCYLAPRAL
eukprot:1217628-Alexandrium_andersonii.AAC.1